MSIKKTLLCLQMAATIISQIGVVYTPNVQADSTYNCKDVEVYFTEGYGWSSGLASSQDSFNFEVELEKLLWDEDSQDYKVKYGFHSITAGVDFVKRLTWLDAANIVLNPTEAAELRKNIISKGESIASSVNYNEHVGRCPDTKYVIAGFGMGAAKARQALTSISPDKVLYVALFSDPTLYLPEGKGILPDACLGKNLSDYRMYVPNCWTHDGILGGANPYIPAGYTGKVGTWCNKNDMFCGSGVSMSGHSSYYEDGIYEDAAKVIYDKIRQAYDLDHSYSIHDTAILIDSTGSMDALIAKYKEEALSLAKQTLEAGGRVALYDYRDYEESYYPVQHCDFETCTLQKFQEGLDAIVADNGGDIPESLLWSAKIVMNELTWQKGATKSLVVLTDAGFHDPDLDGTTLADIVKLSKTIDPVNIYVVTANDIMDDYSELTTETDGSVVSSTSDLSMLTTKIMERYDSLPRVEESTDEYEGDVSDKALILALFEEKIRTGEISDPLTTKNVNSASPSPIIPKAPNTGKR